MDLMKALFISASGLRAEGSRMRTISENIANADSTADTPGGDPYRRKTITFKNYMDKDVQAPLVRVGKMGVDNSDFEMKYEPGHPAADENGFVKYPNVNPLVEMMDMTEAQRSYEANVNVIELSRNMLQRTIDILKS